MEVEGKAKTGYLLVTQERIGFATKPTVFAKPTLDLDVPLESLTNIAKTEVRGYGRLSLNDGKKQILVSLEDPEMVATLLDHLQWARIGFQSSFIEELGFEPDLVSVCKDDILAERYEDAIRKAYTLLESKVRDAIAVIAESRDVGVNLMEKAFNPTGGPLSFGKTQSERNGLASLYRGAILMFRNPVAHQYGYLEYSKAEAFEIIAFADLLLRMLSKGVDIKKRGRL